MLFVSLVPHAQVERGSREEPAFCHTQEESDSQETGEILGEAHEGTNDTPHEGDSRKPEPRRCELENDVARDLKQDIADEVDG